MLIDFNFNCFIYLVWRTNLRNHIRELDSYIKSNKLHDYERNSFTWQLHWKQWMDTHWLQAISHWNQIRSMGRELSVHWNQIQDFNKKKAFICIAELCNACRNSEHSNAYFVFYSVSSRFWNLLFLKLRIYLFIYFLLRNANRNQYIVIVCCV